MPKGAVLYVVPTDADLEGWIRVKRAAFPNESAWTVQEFRERHEPDKLVLVAELDGEIVVAGSIRLVRTLMENDLVDELRLMIYPVVLGGGARLFGETSDKKPMRLVDTQTVGDGVAILTYERVRDAERASDGASFQDKRAAALRRAGIRESA